MGLALGSGAGDGEGYFQCLRVENTLRYPLKVYKALLHFILGVRGGEFSPCEHVVARVVQQLVGRHALSL